MLRYIFDSDMFSHYVHGLPALAGRVDACPPEDLVLSAITIDEALTGWYSKIRKERHPERIESAFQSLIDTTIALNDFVLINYSTTSILRYESLKKLKLNVGGNDLRIAAIALEHNATVVSANLRDFSRVPELKVEYWSR